MIGRYNAPSRIMTRREQQLVNCLASGLSVKESAAVMGITGNTAKIYSHKLSQKLGVSGSREIAVWELKRQIRALEDELAPYRVAQCVPGAD